MAGHQSAAIVGAAFAGARSFGFAFNAAGGAAVDKNIDPGSYYVVSVGAASLVRVILTGGSDVAALPSTQPAANAPNGTQYVPADSPQPLDVPPVNTAGTQQQISALGFGTGTGTLVVIGPIRQSSNP